MTDSAAIDRRLGDRILSALQMSLEQEELEIAEMLWTALELALSRYGGPEMLEKRDAPDEFEQALDQLLKLRAARS